MTDPAWDDPAAATDSWGWVTSSLGRFGTVGGDVPAGFERYVSVPAAQVDDAGPSSDLAQLGRLLDAFGVADDAVLHCAVWEGFGGMFREHDATVSGASIAIATSERLDPAQRERLVQAAHEQWVAGLPLRPAVTTLELPDRAYYTWTTTGGRLADDVARLGESAPTIVFPADRSWLWHHEIDSIRAEVGGPARLLDPLLTPAWGGIAVEPSQRLGEIPGWAG